jgi:flagellar motor switch protein FliN/FliY
MSSSLILSSSSDLAPAAAAAAAPALKPPYAGMLDVVCRVDVVLGTGSMTVRDCLKLQRSSVIRLQQLAGSDLEVQIHGVAAARGEVVIIDDGTTIRLTDVIPPPDTEPPA